MRIAITTKTRRKVGGVETYLEGVMPELARRGHELTFFHETVGPAERDPIKLPVGTPAWSVSELGASRALEQLRGWRPDVIFSQGLHEPTIERVAIAVAPTVLLAQDYYGTCISGEKSFQRPAPCPCDHSFSWKCLGRYYPKRCGGLNPLTMLREYRRQSARLDLLKECRTILTLSQHMRDEYLQHGFAEDRVFNLPPWRSSSAGELWERKLSQTMELLFVGRMEHSKGGELLLDALPSAQAKLHRSLSLTMIGDGSHRARWESKAENTCRFNSEIKVRFSGWLSEAEQNDYWKEADLLVFPSVWPEPFGFVGLEAARRGVPVAAFDVGGVREWLRDGVSGHLAPGMPPTNDGLADAIARCLSDQDHYARLCGGAATVWRDINPDDHVAELLQHLELSRQVASRRFALAYAAG